MKYYTRITKQLKRKKYTYYEIQIPPKPFNILRNTMKKYTSTNKIIKSIESIMNYYTTMNKTIEHMKQCSEILYKYH